MKRRSRIAKQKRRCPRCREWLTGIMHHGSGHFPGTISTKTRWFCEGCYTEWVQKRGQGMVRVDDHTCDVTEMMGRWPEEE